jgi:hypothetical protein
VTWRAVAKLLVGLTLGFVGAFVTLQAIDRFGPHTEAGPLEIVLGSPDFDGYCSRADGWRLRGVATTGDALGWRCVGSVRGLWTTEPVVVDDVCKWAHGPTAAARLVDEAADDGWLCVSTP